MRATSQQGPFCHCKACYAPLNSKPIEDGIKRQIASAKAFDHPAEYIAKLELRLTREYYGAYEELCPRCLDAALNPPSKDGVELDGLFWFREVDKVMDEYYASLEHDGDSKDLPW